MCLCPYDRFCLTKPQMQTVSGGSQMQIAFVVVSGMGRGLVCKWEGAQSQQKEWRQDQKDNVNKRTLAFIKMRKKILVLAIQTFAISRLKQTNAFIYCPAQHESIVTWYVGRILMVLLFDCITSVTLMQTS